MLNFLIPGYLQEDPSLVKVYGEKAADTCAARLEGKAVADMLPPKDKRPHMPTVTREATVMECAAVMAALHSPLLVVVEDERRPHTGGVDDGELGGLLAAHDDELGAIGAMAMRHQLQIPSQALVDLVPRHHDRLPCDGRT